MSNANFDRRQITAGLAAAMTLPLAGGLTTLAPATVRAQSTGLWGNLAELSEEAQKLGLSVPRMSLAPSAGGDTYAEQLPAVIDFMDSVQGSAPDATGVSSAQVEALLERASDILRTARNAERVPRDIPEPGAAPSLRRSSRPSPTITASCSPPARSGTRTAPTYSGTCRKSPILRAANPMSR